MEDTCEDEEMGEGPHRHKIMRKDGDVACIQNIFPRFAEQNLSNLYTPEGGDMSCIKIDGRILKKQLDLN